MNKRTLNDVNRKLKKAGFADWQIRAVKSWVGDARYARRFRTRMKLVWGVKL